MNVNEAEIYGVRWERTYLIFRYSQAYVAYSHEVKRVGFEGERL